MMKKRRTIRAIEGHLYKHTKSGRLYIVLARTENEDGAADIKYTRAGDCFGEMLYSQPEHRFLETVKIDGVKHPRFQYVGPHPDVLAIRYVFNNLSLKMIRDAFKRQTNPRPRSAETPAAS